MSAVMPVRGFHFGHLHPYVAAILASISGFLMVNAGVAFSEGGWGSARPFALGGGIAIQAALFMERGGVRERGPHGSELGRPIALQLGASAFILTTGVGLFWIGHQTSVTGWWPLGLGFAPIILLLGAATALNRRAAKARMSAHLKQGQEHDSPTKAAVRTFSTKSSPPPAAAGTSPAGGLRPSSAPHAADKSLPEPIARKFRAPGVSHAWCRHRPTQAEDFSE